VKRTGGPELGTTGRILNVLLLFVPVSPKPPIKDLYTLLFEILKETQLLAAIGALRQMFLNPFCLIRRSLFVYIEREHVA
jgi:hypothetical protein